MYVFGTIDNTSTNIESNEVNYSQNLNTSSLGIQTIKIISGSNNTNHWNSLNTLFYTSGSPKYIGENRFQNSAVNLSITQKVGEQFLSKYHGYPSSSLIPIPNQYTGEKIKEGSFRLTDLNNTDGSGVNPIIRDDGFGNLYATNANPNFGTLTASSAGANNSISSSLNYVGNIFYDKGLAIITETGSWSGSVKYSDLAVNYNLVFDSTHTIVTHEYSVNILPNEFNHSTNYTLRDSGSIPLDLGTQNLKNVHTASNFQPYITQIKLYQEGDYEEPVIQANLPKPIRKSDKLNMTFKIKLDI